MTVLTFWRDEERALIATDTMAYPGNGSGLELSKTYYLPHAQLVLAARGLLYFSRAFFDWLHFYGADYDRAMEIAGEALKWADTTTAEYFQQTAAYGPPDQTEQNIAVIGWSAAAGAMRSTVFVRQSMADGFRRYDEPCMIGPWDARWGECPITAPSSISLLHEIASLQVRHALADGLPGFGGRLVLGELTRDSFRCETRSFQSLKGPTPV